MTAYHCPDVDTFTCEGVDLTTMAQANKRVRKKQTKRREEIDSIPPTQMVSVKELSRYLGVGRKTLRKLIRAGQIPYAKVGAQYRFDVLAVRAAIDRTS